MDALFLVKSPLQLLNAIEARYAFTLREDACLLILMGDRKNQQQLYNMVRSDQSWRHVIALDRYQGKNIQKEISSFDESPRRLFRNSFWSVRKLSRIAADIGHVDFLFVGDYANELMRHFAHSVTYDQLVLLDDGHATIQYAQQRYAGCTPTGHLRKSKALRLWLKRRCFGLNDRPPEAVTYFTVYDIRLNSCDRVVANNFEYIRSLWCNDALSDHVFFLGSPLTEAGFLDEDEFFWHLGKVKEYFPGQKILYVAHRRESKRRLLRIERKLGIRVQRFTYPIEYQIAMLGPTPRVLASFFSSALENCRMIFEDKLEICSFRLDPGHFSRRNTVKGQTVDKIYAYYEEHVGDAFKIAELTDLPEYRRDLKEAVPRA